jgi:hypothetical protein
MPLPDTLRRLAPRLLPLLACALALTAALSRIPSTDTPQLLVDAAHDNALPAALHSERIPESQGAESVSLTQLADGRLAAAWVLPGEQPAIAFSILERTGWQAPSLVANRESTAGSTFAFSRRIDAPVLHAEGGWLHLWYAAHAVDARALAEMHHLESTDSGKRWQPPRRLNTGTPSGYQPVAPAQPLADGGLGLAGLSGGDAAWFRFSPSGQLLDKTRLTGDVAAHHLAIAALSPTRALALLRTEAVAQVQRQLSDNAGLAWQAGEASDLALARAPFALTRLQDGRLLLAGHPAGDSATLALWLSADEGLHWQAARTLTQAAEGASDFAFPALLTARDGRVHLIYRERDHGLRHLVFTPAWLRGEAA